ncbi:MAG: transcription antitermination factor NusB [Omnitrophica WOR_2 bacterium RIFCSPHIGHO2_02_FULL_67_20]|nr:MAG: transcription antitermination factor NusB [Omnitrophica WOR_2 bacterium RIFCSPHIGHO2_02_FULL_67_20]
MRNRTKSRECALQMLYQVDIRHADPKQVIEEFWQAEAQVADDVKSYANQLVEGTRQRLTDIDGVISAHADNWNLKRMAVIDRNILRLGAFELLYLDDVPAKVCINEAIELAKRFGDTESGKFINGILDAIYKKRHAPSQDR